jgi:tetratricopeptide (TPR) repeat protein
MQDVEALLKLNPGSAQGYYYQGLLYERAGNYVAALASYERAASHASDAGQTEMEALARVQIAQMLQFMSASTPGAP